MKFSVQLARVLVGLLFIFSGIVKINDPSGTGIKLEEYFTKFSQDLAAPQDSFVFEIKSNNKQLFHKSQLLILGEKSKTIDLWSSTSTQLDSAGKMISLYYNLKCNLDSIEHSVAAVNFINLKEPRNINLTARVGAKLIFENSQIVKPYDNFKWKKTLDINNYVKPDSWMQRFFNFCKKNALVFSLVFCALEIILGFALLIGWKTKFISILLLCTIIFFSFLTGYSWLSGYGATKWVFLFSLILVLFLVLFTVFKNQKYRKILLISGILITLLMAYLCWIKQWCFTCSFNPLKMKVTDCGCFGDFIKLKPWVSFYKDIILLFLILIVYWGSMHIKPLFSKGFAWKFMSLITLGAVGFGLYCYMYLPVWDFLPFKEGNNIASLMKYDAKSGLPQFDQVQTKWHLTKGSDSVVVTDVNKYTALVNQGYRFVWEEKQMLAEGYKPPIQNFNISRNTVDYKDSFLNSKQPQMMLVVPFMNEGYQEYFDKLKEIVNWAALQKIKLYIVTASPTDEMDAFLKQKGIHNLSYNADEKLLRTMARYSPTFYLFKGPVVVNKWSGRWLPSTNRLEKEINKK